MIELQPLLDHLGVGVGAVTGILAARGKRIDLFGVVFLAVVTAFGGGTVRDLLLGATPVFWVTSPQYLTTAVTVAAATFILARYVTFPRRTLLVADAATLAVFTMVGAKKALLFGASPAIAVTMGITTGVVGGVLRDVLLGEIPVVFRREIGLYATAALIGATAYVVLQGLGTPLEWRSLVIGGAIVFVLRLAAIRWRITLPEFETGIGAAPSDPQRGGSS